jgi:thiosulfate dehydrogenase
MENLSPLEKQLMKSVALMSRLTMWMFFIVLGLLIYIVAFTENTFWSSVPDKDQTTASVIKQKDPNGFWESPSTSILKDVHSRELVEYGKELIVNTSFYFGPKGTVRPLSTNGMNCQNCHLNAGTKIFGNNYGAVAATYPKYRARSGSIENIYKRVNDCFERSLNGQPLDSSSKEMQAIVAYIAFLGSEVPKGQKPKGTGFQELSLIDRSCDPIKGGAVYEHKCASCHQQNGEGQMSPDGKKFVYPPLWGPNSYNDGAGLFRITNFAKFVKSNMPLGAAHDNAILSDEEAWDVAAFVNNQVRPKKDISKDWPNIKEKPMDHPFGPYADNFSEKQHKFGPWQAMKAKR